MGRIRSVKPELFKHGDLFDLEQESGLPIRLAWIGLFTAADRDGRFKWRPRELQTDIMPYDPPGMIEKILRTLEQAGFVEQYEIDGQIYGHIPTWNLHQVIRVDEAKSRIPTPPGASAPSPLRTRDEPVTDPLEPEKNPHRGVGVGVGVGTGKGSGVGVAEPTAQLAAPSGDLPGVIQELRGNSRIEETLINVPLEVQRDWVVRWETRSIKETLLNGINHYMNEAGARMASEIDDWNKKLVSWVNREKKSLLKRRTAALVSHIPPPIDVPASTADEILSSIETAKKKGFGSSVLEKLERQAGGGT